MNVKALKDNKESIKTHFSVYGIDIKCFSVRGKEWTTLSYKVPVQRKFNSKTAFYKIDDGLAIDELKTLGVKLA